jgi:hypothetical protein
LEMMLCTFMRSLGPAQVLVRDPLGIDGVL